MTNNGIEQVTQPEVQRFFADIDSRMAHGSSFSSQMDRREMTDFFDAVSSRVTVAEKRQRQLDLNAATHFNVFDLIEPDENKLSDILGDLLDPKGSHGQGDVFLRLLLEKLGFNSATRLARNARVQREALTYGIQKHRRRMDILVDAGLLLAIENKVDSAEQDAQVSDYLEHLRHCAKVGKKQGVLIYLTPNQRRPDSLSSGVCVEAEATGMLYCWSYKKEILSWLEACHQECRAEKIRCFLADFIAYIESHMNWEPEVEGHANE